MKVHGFQNMDRPRTSKFLGEIQEKNDDAANESPHIFPKTSALPI